MQGLSKTPPGTTQDFLRAGRATIASSSQYSFASSLTLSHSSSQDGPYEHKYHVKSPSESLKLGNLGPHHNSSSRNRFSKLTLLVTYSHVRIYAESRFQKILHVAHVWLAAQTNLVGFDQFDLISTQVR